MANVAGIFAVLVFATLLQCVSKAQTAFVSQSTFPADGEIRQMLAERVTAIAGREDGIGIVVGLVGPQGKRIISYGHSENGDPRPLTGDTIFEIGSVGKVFTALVLADAIQRREVALADPAAKYLPADTHIPERNGHQITLVELATHTSGLPFMPDTTPIVNMGSAHYGTRDLYNFLARYQLTRDPGTDWEYSNIDYWLLAQALATRADTDYDALLQRRIFSPLGLKSTTVKVSDKLRMRLATGHDAALKPAIPFYGLSIYSTLGASAGGIYSTANDLLSFLSDVMGYEGSALAPAMAAMLETRQPMDGSEQALGWIVVGKGDRQFIFHDGGTWGYASAAAWDPKSRMGVVVLSNQQESVSDIARHLLRPELPLEKPAIAKHKETSLAPTLLDGYVGSYAADGVGVFNIRRENDFLTLQLPADWGLPNFRLHPETREEFFVAEMPIHVTFSTDAKGQVTGALIYPPRGQHGIQTRRVNVGK